MLRKWLVIIMLFSIIITSCGKRDQAVDQAQNVDYQQVKQMVIDAIHTKEGKKAIQEILQDPEFQTQMQLQSKTMQEFLTKSFSNETTKKNWVKLLTNPQVAEQMMKAAEKQQQETMKILMKDPKFQQSMMDLLKDPVFTQHLLQVMKSKENRQETLKLIQETLKTPSFQDELKKKIQEVQPQQEKSGEEGGSEGDSGSEGGSGGEGS